MSQFRRAMRSRSQQLGSEAIRRMDRRRDAVKRFQFLALEDTECSEAVEEQQASRPKATRRCSARQRRERSLGLLNAPSGSDRGEKEKRTARKRSTEDCITGRCKASYIDLTKDSDSEAIDLAMNRGIHTVPKYCESCTAIRCLCKGEDMTLKEAFKMEGTEVISYIPESAIYLRGASFRRLQGSRWLDDEIINCFVGMINARNKRIHASMVPSSPPNASRRRPRTFMFNSFFYIVLCRGRIGFNYSGARRWTQRAKLDITEYDLILVPIHATNNHWVLGTIDMVRGEVGYLDSMENKDELGVVTRLKRWLHAELVEENKGAAVAKDLKVRKWSKIENKYIPYGTNEARTPPSQTDSSSCGIFMLTFANCLSMGKKMDFSQTDIPSLRKEIALNLLRGYLPL